MILDEMPERAKACPNLGGGAGRPVLDAVIYWSRRMNVVYVAKTIKGAIKLLMHID